MIALKRVTLKFRRLLHVFGYLLTRPHIFRNAAVVFLEEGPDVFLRRTVALFRGKRPYRYEAPVHSAPVDEAILKLASRPLISILLPVYNVAPRYLEEAIGSVISQWYPHWELCICDDASTHADTVEYLRSLNHDKIKITFSRTNQNISGATNSALALAEGDYVALLDHDDTLTPDALFEIVKAINDTEADFIYSDEDLMNSSGKKVFGHFKPDYAPDMLLSHNYITHLAVLRRSLMEQVGGCDARYDGAQDYDLFLRVTEQTRNVHHIPRVLYHWRMHKHSTSAHADAKPEAANRAQRALEAALERRRIEGTVLPANLPHYFRVKRAIAGTPLVSIIIPFKDRPELLSACIGSILEKSTYPHFEIIGIDNRSRLPETFAMMEALQQRDSRITFHGHDRPFNYSAINNQAVRHYARGEHVLLLNNDIEIITPGWIEALLEHSQRPEVGCVGAKLYYGDGTIQHGGAIIGLGGYVAHSHRCSPGDATGYFNRLNIIQNLSAVTGACLMVKKNIYLEMGGLDEEHFTVAYNDIDFCLRVREHGYLNIFTPYCEAYHFESKSRGIDSANPEKTRRFQLEKDYLAQRHPVVLTQNDPYYNRNLTLDDEDFSLR